METWFYVIESIDGDYANLRRTDIESDDLKLVARALLPDGIAEGTQLKYELIQATGFDVYGADTEAILAKACEEL